MARTFPMSTNVNERVLLALGSDCKGRDNVEISRVGVSPIFWYQNNERVTGIYVFSSF